MTLFGLSEADLLLVVETIHGDPVLSVRIDRSNPLKAGQGLCGDKLLVDLSYTTREGRVGSATLFVKKFSWKGKSEAVHYRLLEANGVPTPRLYGAVRHSDGDEILFLERLTAIGFDRHNESEWRRLLTLLARFNACPVPAEIVPSLHPFEQGGQVGGWWITGFSDFPPPREEIEANLRLCGVEARELPALCTAAQQLCERVAALPKGLLHQDFLSDNLGWRGERAEMVVFDVHKNCVGPRFADVGPYLGLPDWSNTAAFLDESRDLSPSEATPIDESFSRRESLTRHYLEAYARYGGETVSLETFREETELLSLAHKVAVLWWLAEQQDAARISELLSLLRNTPLS